MKVTRRSSWGPPLCLQQTWLGSCRLVGTSPGLRKTPSGPGPPPHIFISRPLRHSVADHISMEVYVCFGDRLVPTKKKKKKELFCATVSSPGCPSVGPHKSGVVNVRTSRPSNPSFPHVQYKWINLVNPQMHRLSQQHCLGRIMRLIHI